MNKPMKIFMYTTSGAVLGYTLGTLLHKVYVKYKSRNIRWDLIQQALDLEALIDTNEQMDELDKAYEDLHVDAFIDHMTEVVEQKKNEEVQEETVNKTPKPQKKVRIIPKTNKHESLEVEESGSDIKPDDSETISIFDIARRPKTKLPDNVRHATDILKENMMETRKKFFGVTDEENEEYYMTQMDKQEKWRVLDEESAEMAERFGIERAPEGITVTASDGTEVDVNSFEAEDVWIDNVLTDIHLEIDTLNAEDITRAQMMFGLPVEELDPELEVILKSYAEYIVRPHGDDYRMCESAMLDRVEFLTDDSKHSDNFTYLEYFLVGLKYLASQLEDDCPLIVLANYIVHLTQIHMMKSNEMGAAIQMIVQHQYQPAKGFYGFLYQPIQLKSLEEEIDYMAGELNEQFNPEVDDIY